MKMDGTILESICSFQLNKLSMEITTKLHMNNVCIITVSWKKESLTAN